jgi:hypothetical protein
MPKSYLELAFEGSYIGRSRNYRSLELWRYNANIFLVNPIDEIFVPLTDPYDNPMRY